MNILSKVEDNFETIHFLCSVITDFTPKVCPAGQTEVNGVCKGKRQNYASHIAARSAMDLAQVWGVVV